METRRLRQARFIGVLLTTALGLGLIYGLLIAGFGQADFLLTWWGTFLRGVGAVLVCLAIAGFIDRRWSGHYGTPPSTQPDGRTVGRSDPGRPYGPGVEPASGGISTKIGNDGRTGVLSTMTSDGAVHSCIDRAVYQLRKKFHDLPPRRP